MRAFLALLLSLTSSPGNGPKPALLEPWLKGHSHAFLNQNVTRAISSLELYASDRPDWPKIDWKRSTIAHLGEPYLKGTYRIRLVGTGPTPPVLLETDWNEESPEAFFNLSTSHVPAAAYLLQHILLSKLGDEDQTTGTGVFEFGRIAELALTRGPISSLEFHEEFATWLTIPSRKVLDADGIPSFRLIPGGESETKEKVKSLSSNSDRTLTYYRIQLPWKRNGLESRGFAPQIFRRNFRVIQETACVAEHPTEGFLSTSLASSGPPVTVALDRTYTVWDRKLAFPTTLVLPSDAFFEHAVSKWRDTGLFRDLLNALAKDIPGGVVQELSDGTQKAVVLPAECSQLLGNSRRAD